MNQSELSEIITRKKIRQLKSNESNESKDGFHIKASNDNNSKKNFKHNALIFKLPLKVRFKQSKMYASVIPILLVGLLVGFLGSFLGVGGGFLLVPLLIYFIKMPTRMVIGTSMLNILCVMGMSSVIYALEGQRLEIILAFLTVLGSSIGSKIGANFSLSIRPEMLRLLLGVMILFVVMVFVYKLYSQPSVVFEILSI